MPSAALPGVSTTSMKLIPSPSNDLVRLAASALLAIEENDLELGKKSACRAILDGYLEGLNAGGHPFVIGDQHRWFKPILQDVSRDPGLYWDKLHALPRQRLPVPREAATFLAELLPSSKIHFHITHRIAGLGNLGKPRFTTLVEWNGGPVAREVKALTLSAAAWAANASDGPFYSQILARSIRSADPFLKVHNRWIGRRLGPECGRIELVSFRRLKDQEWLLHAMGFETANIHLGSAKPSALRNHLHRLRPNWLRDAAAQMHDLLLADFKQWRS